MSPTAIGVMTLAATGVGVVLTWILAVDLDLSTRFRVNKRIDKAFLARQEKGVRKGSLFKDLKLIQAETAKTERNIWQRFCGIVEQSGIDVSPRQLLIGALAAGPFAGVVAGGISRNWLVGLGIAVLVRCCSDRVRPPPAPGSPGKDAEATPRRVRNDEPRSPRRTNHGRRGSIDC